MEPANGTKLVRMSTELFEQLAQRYGEVVFVEWGEPVEYVLKRAADTPGWQHYEEEPVYSPTIRKNFDHDLDEVEEWVP